MLTIKKRAHVAKFLRDFGVAPTPARFLGLRKQWLDALEGVSVIDLRRVREPLSQSEHAENV